MHIHTGYYASRVVASIHSQLWSKLYCKENKPHGYRQLSVVIECRGFCFHLCYSAVFAASSGLSVSGIFYIFGRFKFGDNPASLIPDEESRETSIAPSQTALVPLFISQKKDVVADCKDFRWGWKIGFLWL